MKTLECKSNSGRYALTVDNKYEIVEIESNGSFVVVVNDRGIEARYSSSLFAREEQPPTESKKDLSWSVKLRENNVWEATFTGGGLTSPRTIQFLLKNSPISCGIVHLNGLNPLLSLLEECYNKDELDKKVNSFTSALKSVLDAENEEGGTSAFVFASPAVSEDDSEITALVDKVVEVTSSITASPWRVNPNSGNFIRVLAIDLNAFL